MVKGCKNRGTEWKLLKGKMPIKHLYRIILATIVILVNSMAGCYAVNQTQAARGVLKRLLPNKENQFLLQIIPKQDGLDVFEIDSSDDRIVLRGSTGVAITTALNWYLKYYCNAHVSWHANQLNLPQQLPKVDKKIRIVSPYKHRYYLNYCTHSYSMAFWDWQRWEKEIDWMALNGITMPLAITGQEAVWQNTLRKFNMSDEQIENYICGPAFFPWWLMGNLEGWGGPLPQSWIDQHVELQQKILARMRELAMTPVLQAFYGIAPNAMKEKFPNANIIDCGDWVGFKRPAFLDPTDPLFAEMATVFYQEQEKLFGKVQYYAGDPFHEGGTSKGVDITESARAIHKAMIDANPQAVWVLQSWQDNPTEDLLAGTVKDQTVIVDLWCDSRPHWGKQPSQWYRENGFLGHPWIWSVLPSFGGRTGMFGKLQTIANDLPQALQSPKRGNLCGMGTMTEAIELNPVLYDLLFEMAWRKTSPDINQWIREYSHRRYGKALPQAEKAWTILLDTVYGSSKDHVVTMPSIFCNRPPSEIKEDSGWLSARIPYDPNKLVNAWGLLLSCADKLGSVDTYQYDLVDLTRQVLTDTGLQLYQNMIAAYQAKDKNRFEILSQQFLGLIRDQDSLLATRKEFLLGPWIASAKNWAKTDSQRQLYEWNAKTLITVWGPRKTSQQLHDYSSREWSGLLVDFYLPRWQMYIDNLKNQLEGQKAEKIDFFAWEEKWPNQAKSYPTTPVGDPVDQARSMFNKYKPLLESLGIKSDAVQ